MMLTQERLRELLDYDHETGLFTWRKNRGGSALAGSIAGAIDSKGYVQIRVDRRLYLAHRLAWLFVYGRFPEMHLDHRDRNPRNNAIRNLRLCTRSENQQNVGVRANNSSGTTGVSLHGPSRKWVALITVDGKRIRVGQFDSKSEAVNARLAAKERWHSFHPKQPPDEDPSYQSSRLLESKGGS